MLVPNAAQTTKSVADPNAYYESLKPLWEKSRAVCGGERFVKAYDGLLDVFTYTNLLIPFSPSMSINQYNFYKAEAELPGITKEYSKMIVGGLLRKDPQLTLSDKIPKEAKEWILSRFCHDSSPIISFLDEALKEEIQTSRAWVYVDYPKINNPEALDQTDFKSLKPYPLLWKAENIVNWKVNTNSQSGEQTLERIIYRGLVEDYTRNEFHPELIDTVWVHEIVNGKYQIRTFAKQSSETNVPVVNGKTQPLIKTASEVRFELTDTNQNIMVNGERMRFIPAWPLNGSIEPIEPILITLVDREISLYNKISRRNHLLYGAATYTPIVASDMTEEDFQKIVDAGLGSWIKLQKGETCTALETPTGALQDMDRAISATIDDMGKLGVRMLTPETQQSGVALEIRNAAQTASIGTLNTKISSQMSDIIAFMIGWKFDIQGLTSEDVKFTLSPDFNPAPLGADWLRLVTEWYQQGLIPRSEWISIGKHNDIISADYNDEVGMQEITADEVINVQKNMDYAAQMQQQSQQLT
jgi:hypothetical protein